MSASLPIATNLSQRRRLRLGNLALLAMVAPA
jgi:hypothetical protein